MRKWKKPPPYRFNTQPPEGGCLEVVRPYAVAFVSTHSRLKAAGQPETDFIVLTRFNTQPPEGGWNR